MGILACVGVLLPFPFYYWLWTNPQSWVELCGSGRDPSKVMAQVAHLLKLIQVVSLFSVSSLSWPPPLYFWPLFIFGQFLNFRVYQLLGESGTYYGVRFGKQIPWVTEFPFGTIKDPQYVGSIMSLLACLAWVPFPYIFLWILGYLFMIHLELKEDPATRAKTLHQVLQEIDKPVAGTNLKDTFLTFQVSRVSIPLPPWAINLLICISSLASKHIVSFLHSIRAAKSADSLMARSFACAAKHSFF